MSAHKVTASREFNELGNRWFPQIRVETLGLWADIASVCYKNPQGFAVANDAIRADMADTE